MSPMAKKGVSKGAWLEAAAEVLMTEGVDAIKIDRLATGFGISRSGFYWHFKDRRDLLDRLLEWWIHEFTEVVLRNPEIDEGSPVERLIRIAAMIEDFELTRPELAVHAWAAHDPRARDFVDRAMAMREEFVASVFAELGIEGDDLAARTRLFVCYFTWESTIFGSEPPEKAAARRRRQIDLMTLPSGDSGA